LGFDGGELELPQIKQCQFRVSLTRHSQKFLRYLTPPRSAEHRFGLTVTFTGSSRSGDRRSIIAHLPGGGVKLHPKKSRHKLFA
jgi:hypothetical protein